MRRRGPEVWDGDGGWDEHSGGDEVAKFWKEKDVCIVWAGLTDYWIFKL